MQKLSYEPVHCGQLLYEDQVAAQLRIDEASVVLLVKSFP